MIQSKAECMAMVGYVAKTQILGQAIASKGSKSLDVLTEVGTPNIIYAVSQNGVVVDNFREYSDAVDKYLSIPI